MARHLLLYDYLEKLCSADFASKVPRLLRIECRFGGHVSHVDIIRASCHFTWALLALPVLVSRVLDSNCATNISILFYSHLSLLQRRLHGYIFVGVVRRDADRLLS